MSANDRTLGGHWLSPVIADDLAPGQPPHPSQGVEGPPLALPLQQWEQHLAEIRQLGRAAALNGFDFTAGTATGATDSSGNAVIGLYQVAAGVEAWLTRLVVNARVAASNAIYTPAVPYSNAAAYLALYQAASPAVNDIGDAGLLDFAPPTAGGPIFPGLFTDNSMQAAFVRGPAWYVLRVVSGPASSSVTCRYQLALRRAAGIA